MNATRKLMIGALAVGAGLLAGALASAAELKASVPRKIDFSVQDRAGGAHVASEFRARATLVHFWASWCMPCREELPALEALQADMRKDGVRVVAISTDRLGWDVIDRTAKATGLRDLALFHDLNHQSAKALDVEGLPTTILVDDTGTEVARIRGQGDWRDAAVRRAILEHVGK